MSQYLIKNFNSLKYILFNLLINLTFCDNQSFKILIFNDSSVIVKRINSNLTFDNKNDENLTNSTTNLNDNNLYYLNTKWPKFCSVNENCDSDEKCCPYSDFGKVCIQNMHDPHCKGKNGENTCSLF